MAVQARFWVQKVTKWATSGDNVMHEVQLQPKVRPDGNDNVDWSKYTPSGTITMTVTQGDAATWFEDRIGKDVAITFDDPE